RARVGGERKAARGPHEGARSGPPEGPPPPPPPPRPSGRGARAAPPLPRDGAREQGGGEVRAGEQQQEADARHERERNALLALDEVRLEEGGVHAAPLQRRGPRVLRADREGRELPAGGLARHARRAAPPHEAD